MGKPKLITFDYEGTLLANVYRSPADGFRNIYMHITENPRNVSCDKAIDFFERMRVRHRDAERSPILETMSEQLVTTTLRYAGWKIDGNDADLEMMYADGVFCEDIILPGVQEFLDKCEKKGIRMGVVCNFSLRGETLRRRLANVFGKDYFDFVLTSSECLFRKPEPLLYELALACGNASASQTWHIGDSYACDVMGARRMGIKAVYYNPEERDGEGDITVKSWNELSSLLDLFEDN